jgi:F-type H+-transporting ATPase subunit b
MVLSFGVVLFILSRYGFPVIVKMVENRREFIRKSLDEAEDARKLLGKVKEESQAILLSAREEQVRIIRDASIAGEKIISSAKDEARIVSAKELEKAKKEIEKEREITMKKIRNEMALISLGIAEKILKEKLESSESQMKMINRLLDENVDLRS